MTASYSFAGKIWRTSAGAGWFFLTLPDDLTMLIRTRALGLMRSFGSLRVSALIGKTKWNTSIFFDTEANAFLLPVKADVRRKEKIAVGDAVTCSIAFER